MEAKTVYIEEYEPILKRLINSGSMFWKVSEDEANPTMFNAYCNSKGEGKALLDFNDVILDTDVQPIAETLRRARINEFTISIHQKNILEILAAFSDLGVVVQGITRIEKWRCGEQEAPAFLMKVE